MAAFGLYGNLPSAKDEEASKDGVAKKEGWSGSALFAPNLAAKRQSEYRGGVRQAQQRPLDTSTC
jgi:hypothetical protein